MANMLLFLNDFKNKGSYKFFVCSILTHQETISTVTRVTSGNIDLSFKPLSDEYRKIDYFLNLASCDHTAYDKILTDSEFETFIELHSKR